MTENQDALQRNTRKLTIIPFENASKNNIVSQSAAPDWLLRRYHDSSYIYDHEKLQKKDQNLRPWFILFKKLGYISPESNLLLIWNFMFLIATLFNLYEIPVSMLFTEAVYIQQFNNPIGIILNTLFTICISIHVFIIRPLTAYYHEGILIFKVRDIIRRYLQLQFWLNLIAWLSLLLYVLSGNQTFIYAKILFYSIFLCFLRTKDMINNKIQVYRIPSALYKLINLLSMLLILLIWVASIFFAIDYSYYKQQNQYFPVNLWLTNTLACQYSDLNFIDLIQTYTWPVWFNYSMYWVLQTVSGVGYGDITARNPVQVAYVDVVIVTFCLFYALFINSVWQIIKDFSISNPNNKTKILKYYQKNYNVQKSVLNKLQNYIYFTTKSNQKQQKQKQINQKLSDQLRNQLLIAKQQKTFIQILFVQQLSILLNQEYGIFLFDLVSRVKEHRYGEGEVIVNVRDKDVNMYIISTGQVVLSIPNSKLKLDVKENMRDNFFGVYDFLCRKVSSYQATTSKYSKISSLSQEGYQQVLKENKKARVSCYFLYEEMIIYGKYKLSSEKCWSCQDMHHSVYSCENYFKWLPFLRNCLQIKKASQLNKMKIEFRRYKGRKGNKLEKILRKRQNSSDYSLVQNVNKDRDGRHLVDILEQRNKNRIDKIMAYVQYRTTYNM